MHYVAPKNYTKLPVKLGFYLPNPQETISDIEAQGLDILVHPKPSPRFNPLNYRLAKDPDGYLLEIKQSVECKRASNGCMDMFELTGTGVNHTDGSYAVFRERNLNKDHLIITGARIGNAQVLEIQKKEVRVYFKKQSALVFKEICIRD